MNQTDADPPHHADTRFGFEYGDATIERCWHRNGYVSVMVSVMVRSLTTGKFVEIVVSPKGRSIRTERGSMR